MKKRAIIFGSTVVILILITSIVLCAVFNLREPTIRYRVITLEDDRRAGNEHSLLYIPEYGWGSSIVNRDRIDGFFVTIDAGTAVRIAQMLIFERRLDAPLQPYLVYHDNENDVLIVLAYAADRHAPYDRHAVYRVIVCGITGGILFKTTLLRGNLRDFE